MDKIIPKEVLIRRKKMTFLVALIIFSSVAFLFVLFRIWIKPSVNRSKIVTAVVETGSIENTITASGEILPEFEQVITSPINSSVQKVLTEAGTAISPGQAILTLDKSSAQTEYEKQKFQLESRQNTIHKLRLELGKSFYDLKSNNEIKELKINSLKASLEDYKRLFRAGGATKEDVARAELDLKVAQLEKKQLENEIRNKQQTMKSEMRESEIAAAIEENGLHALKRKLLQADILASRSGVVTYVNKNIGAAVTEGDVLVRVADLKSFKLSGTISDSYLDQLRKGMPAMIRINDSLLHGKVSNISPGIQNGLISFDVMLNDKSNNLLRPNMKADVYLVTDSKGKVTRVANGPAFKGNGAQDIFILQNGKAVKRSVHTGMSNFDYIELKDNVREGEVVVISDMSDFKNAKEINIRK